MGARAPTPADTCPALCGEKIPFSASDDFSRKSHVESTGTSVFDNRYDASIAKPTAQRQGMNRERLMPTMKKGWDKYRHDRKHRKQARSDSLTRSFKDSRNEAALLEPCGYEYFNRDGCLINENTDRKRQSSERHDVDRLPGQPKSHQSGQ